MVDPLFSLLLQRFGDDAHGPEVAGPCAAWWAAVREVRQLRQMCAHPERWRSYQLAHELNSGIFGDLEHFAELFLAVSGDDRLVADATWFMDSGRKVLVVGPDLWWLLMISRCLGLIPLAVLEKLRRLKIRTFGASVAASTLELLASLGAEDISCLDAGLIDPTNIPRLPMADVFSIGQPKAQALVERLSRRNPYGRFQAGVGRAVSTVAERLSADDVLVDEFISDAELIVEVIDDIQMKSYIQTVALKKRPGVPILFIADLGNQPVVNVVRATQDGEVEFPFGRVWTEDERRILDEVIQDHTLIPQAAYLMVKESLPVEHQLQFQLNVHGAMPFWSQTPIASRLSAGLAAKAVITLLDSCTADAPES
jgi:hypothetical protein